MARHVARERRESSRTAWKAMLALWIVVIWVHSLIPGPASTDESMLFVRLAKPLLDLLHVTDIELVHTMVRKGAHFGEYLVLAVLAVMALRPRIQVPLAPAVLFVVLWVAVPCIDELVIQVRVPGRDGSMRDVLIDMAGYLLGAIVSLAIRRMVDEHQRRLAEHERREREERAARYVRRARRRTRERAERAAYEQSHTGSFERQEPVSYGRHGRPVQ